MIMAQTSTTAWGELSTAAAAGGGGSRAETRNQLWGLTLLANSSVNRELPEVLFLLRGV